MKIYFMSFNDYDVKSYEVNEETITVDEFMKMVNEFASHAEDLKETCEIEIALREFEDDNHNITLKDMMDIFNDVSEEWSDIYRVYTWEGTGFWDGDELTVEIYDNDNRCSYGVETQTITFKNLNNDVVKSFEDGIKEWLHNLKFEVYDPDDFFDDSLTPEKFAEENARGIKKFLDYIESGEFRELITPSDEEYFDSPNIITFIDIWNEANELPRKIFMFIGVEILMDEAG